MTRSQRESARGTVAWRVCAAAIACALISTLMLLGTPARGATPPAATARPATAAPARAATALAPWKVDMARSSIRFKATQAGAQFEGRFARFTPDIRFDARDLAHSAARVVIDVSSVDSRSGDRDTALRGGEWFDPKRWPTALFEARRFQAQGSGFVADGQLTIRDRTRPVRFVFTVRTAPDGLRTLQGQATLSRLAFGLGQGEFQSTEWVADAVTVDVTVVAR